jgi:hypothetical protein
MRRFALVLPNLVFGFASFFHLWMSLKAPVTILANAIHDDAMYMSNGMSIANTGWLGPYDQYILAKGPGFPIFLALNSFAGLPLSITLALIFLASTYFLTKTLTRIGMHPLASAMLFTLIAINPASILPRVLRDGLYASLTMLFLALLIRLLVDRPDRTKPFGFVALGAASGFLFLTREEFVWVLPATLVAVVIQLVRRRKPTKSSGIRFLTALTLLGFLIPVSSVAFLNYANYGVWQTNDFTQGQQSAAVRALESIQVFDGSTPYVHVNQMQRTQAYLASPTFRELEQALEVDLKWWTNFGCEIYPSSCGDYAGGWFVWALRDAVASQGYYKSASAANDFYNRVEFEIKAACEQAILTCESPVFPLLPNLERDELERFARSYISAAIFTLQPSPNLQPQPSRADVKQMHEMGQFLGSPNTTPVNLSDSIELAGWYVGDGWLSTVCSGEETGIEVPRLPSPDLANYFSDSSLNNSRFDLDVSPFLDCRLVTTKQGIRNDLGLRWEELAKDGAGYPGLHVDSVRQFKPTEVFSPSKEVRENVLQLLHVILPLLAISAVASILASWVIILRRPILWQSVSSLSFVWLIALALWITRLAVIALVDATYFPAIHTVYLAPAFPLLSVVVALPLAILLKLLSSQTKTPQPL